MVNVGGSHDGGAIPILGSDFLADLGEFRQPQPGVASLAESSPTISTRQKFRLS
jgi:hypothetical protein